MKNKYPFTQVLIMEYFAGSTADSEQSWFLKSVRKFTETCPSKSQANYFTSDLAL